MHLWQLDLVGGIPRRGRECKMLTGIDCHSRFVVVAAGPPARRCEAFIAAMQRWGVPFEVPPPTTGSSSPASSPDRCRRGALRAHLPRVRHSRAPDQTAVTVPHAGVPPPHHQQDRAVPPDAATRTSRRGRSVRQDRSSSSGSRRMDPYLQHPLPHQSLDMATPAGLLRARQDDEPPPAPPRLSVCVDGT